ncbi:hypothetical protein WN982_11280 [Paraburkholderia sp. IMGN_8]|uniref:hypothetical protein n=1 Tax=Paraburkholderia sp. IMGN_8 TaxID=3136564 RepID=UPI003101751E
MPNMSSVDLARARMQRAGPLSETITRWWPLLPRVLAQGSEAITSPVAGLWTGSQENGERQIDAGPINLIICPSLFLI